MIKTGNTELDKFLGKYSEENITALYGEAGTGKTTLCLLAALELASNNKKVIFLDTEQNFSTERIEQILNSKNKECIKNILVLKIKNFNVQHTQVKNLESIKNVSLIVVDSLTHHYRRLYSREPELAKGMLGKQLTILKNIAKKNIPVILTSQVYSSLENNIMPVGKDVLIKLSDKLIKLEKNPRKLTLEKPENKTIKFEIVSEGIKVL